MGLVCGKPAAVWSALPRGGGGFPAEARPWGQYIYQLRQFLCTSTLTPHTTLPRYRSFKRSPPSLPPKTPSQKNHTHTHTHAQAKCPPYLDLYPWCSSTAAAPPPTPVPLQVPRLQATATTCASCLRRRRQPISRRPHRPPTRVWRDSSSSSETRRYDA